MLEAVTPVAKETSWGSKGHLWRQLEDFKSRSIEKHQDPNILANVVSYFKCHLQQTLAYVITRYWEVGRQNGMCSKSSPVFLRCALGSLGFGERCCKRGNEQHQQPKWGPDIQVGRKELYVTLHLKKRFNSLKKYRVFTHTSTHDYTLSKLVKFSF